MVRAGKPFRLATRADHIRPTGHQTFIRFGDFTRVAALRRTRYHLVDNALISNPGTGLSDQCTVEACNFNNILSCRTAFGRRMEPTDGARTA